MDPDETHWRRCALCVERRRQVQCFWCAVLNAADWNQLSDFTNQLFQSLTFLGGPLRFVFGVLHPRSSNSDTLSRSWHPLASG